MNPTYLLAAVDVVAVLVLALAVYYPRHRRADLVTAFVAGRRDQVGHAAPRSA